MNGEDQSDTQQPNNAEADVGSEIETRQGAHRNAELHAMWNRWMLSALALLRIWAPVVSQDYDVTLREDGSSSAQLGPERPNLQLTVDANAGNLMSHADFLDMAEFIFTTPALATGLQMARSLPS